MSLEIHSQKLKEIIATYDSQWLLGDLDFLMGTGKERAKDQLGNISSPLLQLYYLAGLNISDISRIERGLVSPAAYAVFSNNHRLG